MGISKNLENKILQAIHQMSERDIDGMDVSFGERGSKIYITANAEELRTSFYTVLYKGVQYSAGKKG